MKSHRLSHNTIITGVVLVIAAAALTLDGWVYFQIRNHVLSQPAKTSTQVDSMANWKTYDNGIYTFKYPNDGWAAEAVGSIVNLRPTGGWCEPECFTGFHVKETTTTVANFIKDYNNVSAYSQIQSEKPRVFNEISGTDLIGSTDIGIIEHHFFFNKNGKTYILSYDESIKPLEQKILSTFRFTDDINDLQTYSNTDYGFDLQYPKDWKQDNFRGGISGCCFTGSGVVAIDSKEKRPGDHEGVGESLKIYLSDITPTQYATEYNTFNRVGLKGADFVEKKQTETLAGVEVTHMRLGTPIGSYYEVVFFSQGVPKPFYIEYDDYDPLHMQILSTLHFTK